MRIWERIYFIMRFFNLIENWLIINVAKKNEQNRMRKVFVLFFEDFVLDFSQRLIV